jgi:hypothetical protein
VCSEVQVVARGVHDRHWRGQRMRFGLSPSIYVRVGASLVLERCCRVCGVCSGGDRGDSRWGVGVWADVGG